MTRVLFVCTGNTCRSPLAMALARSGWPEGLEVDSAGLRAHPGEGAAPNAAAVARERRADLADHGARRLTTGDLQRPGWIIGMTRSHVAMLARHLDPGGPVRLGLLGAPGLDLRGRATPVAEEVADPIGGDLERYRQTADQLQRLLAAWLPLLLDGTAGHEDQTRERT